MRAGAWGIRRRPPPYWTEPLAVQDALKGPMAEELLSKEPGPRKLHHSTRLELPVGTTKTGVEGVWVSMPSLRSPVPDGSILESSRDLGLGLLNPQTFSLRGSSMKDLDGIGGALSELRELRSKVNQSRVSLRLRAVGACEAFNIQRNCAYELNARWRCLTPFPWLYRKQGAPMKEPRIPLGCSRLVIDTSASRCRADACPS